MVVDDDAAMCDFLRLFLSARGYQPVLLSSTDDLVRRFLAESPAAVILDLLMPGAMDGLQALTALKKIDRDIPIIILSGQGQTSTVVQAMKLGATDFICKPFEDTDLAVPLANALEQRRLSREAALRSCESRFGDAFLFGNSPRMAEVRDLIQRVADTDVTVLIRGESGTGKELVARALYSSSVRRDKAFVKVNCAALPGELLESELFGFERGAFTGAIQTKPGKFEFANHGTMFLDEISEMSPALQAKLLQVLQDGEFSRLGGKHDVHVDVRIVAATNRDLERAVAEGQFREDLFFRLNVVSIQMPPLRARREEIPLLTDHFLRKYSAQYNKPFAEIGEETMQLFLQYDWPGNVRELENLVKRAVVLGGEAGIHREMTQAVGAVRARDTGSNGNGHLNGHGNGHANGHATGVESGRNGASAPGFSRGVETAPADALSPAAMAAAAVEVGNYSLKEISRTAARQAERELIFKMLQHTRWNRKAAAALLGISYKALLYKIKENGFDKVS